LVSSNISLLHQQPKAGGVPERKKRLSQVHHVSAKAEFLGIFRERVLKNNDKVKYQNFKAKQI